MIAAGLIYSNTYGHGLENTRHFYKFADSVLEASRERRSSSTLPSWERRSRGRCRGQNGVFPRRAVGNGVINTASSCQVAAAAPGAGDLKGVTGAGDRVAIFEKAPQGPGRASSGGGTARNVSVRKLSRRSRS
ncbi:unnamed protein product [Ascophyllum nodosum]